MNIKAKITLIIVLTLIIGVALGALLNRALLQRRIGRTIAWGHPAALVISMEQMLDPTDEQYKEIRRILDEHGTALLNIREELMQRTLEVMKALEAALDPLLTPEQKRILSRRQLGPRAFGKPGQSRRPGIQPGKRTMRPGSEELEQLAERLDLTPDQRAQVGSLFQQKNIALPFTFGQDSQEIEVMLGRWINRQEQQDKAIAEILTEEQKRKYDQIKEEHRQRLLDLLNR